MDLKPSRREGGVDRVVPLLQYWRSLKGQILEMMEVDVELQSGGNVSIFHVT